MEYSVQGCGDMLKTAEGTFSSPNYPDSYKHQQECLWTITVPYGNLIELTIEDYDLENSLNCTNDGLAITYSKYLMNETTSNLCGTSKPTDQRKHYTSYTNELFIKLYSNGDFTGRGFNASYKSVQQRKSIAGFTRSVNKYYHFCNQNVEVDSRPAKELLCLRITRAITSRIFTVNG